MALRISKLIDILKQLEATHGDMAICVHGDEKDEILVASDLVIYDGNNQDKTVVYDIDDETKELRVNKYKLHDYDFLKNYVGGFLYID